MPSAKIVGQNAQGHDVDAHGLVVVDGMTGEEMDAQHTQAFANPTGLNQYTKGMSPKGKARVPKK